MPYPRPVSPVSLEECPLPYEIDPDDLLGSDDDLDDAGRDARRRRVENLAKSYLQGKPPFILSASLRGPLETGWVNPWRKTRAHACGASAPRPSSSRQTSAPEKVVLETDLRRRKHFERLPSETSRSEIPVTSRNSPAVSSARGSKRSLTPRSARERPTTVQRLRHSERGERISHSPFKSNEAASSAENEELFAPPKNADWLKKDRKRMNFTKFDPPSSPTIPAASRQMENRARRPASRSVQVQVPQTPASSTKFRAAETISAKPALVNSTSLRHPSPYSARPLNSNVRDMPVVSRSSPFNRRTSTSKTTSLDTSLRVVSSSSQLPRFEYRPWLHDESQQGDQPNLPSEESILQEETILYDDIPDEIPNEMPREYLSVSPIKKQTRAILPGVPQNEETETLNEAPVVDMESLEKDKTQKASSKDLRFADEDDAGTSTYEVIDDPVLTEDNTHDDLPSAQAVPVPLGISDRVTSLHSTLMPKENSQPEMNTNIDTQLSTQAALLHAQKSFQDDLQSPISYKATPGRKRNSPDGATYSANITPFYRTTSQLISEKGRMQAMSTQFMLDAATPYTFSTEKKPRSSRPDSGGTPSTKKTKIAHIADTSSSPINGSLAIDNDFHTAQSSPAEGGQRPASQESDRPPTFQSNASHESFPMTLSRSTPPTIQDGQGAQDAADAFNLSQAIADAGSWLQHSFDFMKDTGRPSQSLTSGGLQSTFNMDLS
ncbi:uncharacterized protein N7511_002247 [Penicillium nucicola]|uniref:uncharacterized protein n=1 Tax=Penicillium nucicola TaxID=1850975 RepID=UPI00254585DC|nr:uncharacterized protein N7511_002247 [Penicillium nucicola]KAJ5770196.1 hypothetical protein N7511_002247 [Penicillium nucicola]